MVCQEFETARILGFRCVGATRAAQIDRFAALMVKVAAVMAEMGGATMTMELQ